MRHASLAACAAVALLCACAPSAGTVVGPLYVKHADSAFAAGRWGEAMAAYDAAHDSAPADATITARRRDAAARWVEATAPEVGRATPPDKALALLSALAEEGNRRGAEAAVQTHVVPLLDAAVSRAWSGEVAGDDPKALWQAISSGVVLTQSLPAGSPARAKLAQLQGRAAAAYDKRAQEAKHPGSAYLYRAMAARMRDAKPDAAAVKALQAVTEFDYRLTLAAPQRCPTLADEFRKRLAYFKNLAPHPGGLPAQVEVQVDCVPLAPPRQRQESRQWVDTHVEYTSAPGSCTDRSVLQNAASHTETTSHGTGIGGGDQLRIVDVKASWKTVRDCDPPRQSSQTVSVRKEDVVTITTQEYGFDARGAAVVTINGKAYRMPVHARVVFEKVTTAGKVFGTREDGVIPVQDFLPLTAHGIWLEMVYLTEKAHEGYVSELLARAEGAPEDARLGDRVSAVRVHQRVTTDYARWFADTLGLDAQQLRELVLDAPRVKPSLKVDGGYKLDVPKLDPNLAREAAEKKRAAGTDDFK